MLQGKLSNSTLTTIALMALSLLTLMSVSPSLQLTATPRIHGGTATSLNWSGYAVTGSTGSVTDAKGSWTVPSIVGSCPSTSQYSSFWVGIDGFNSNTVEQTGTDSDCQNGAPRYYAWFEFYPHPSFIINSVTIHPGDHVSAEAKYSNGKFVVSITDVTSGQSFSTSSTVHSAQRSSAEWIAEAPSSSGGILPLSDFGAVYYGQDTTGTSGTCFATINGNSAPIGSFASNVQKITMVTSSGAVKASPSALTSDGTSFSVQWASSGP